MISKTSYLSGSILDEEMECDLRELCSICNVPEEIIEDMIQEGLISPKGEGPQEWLFTALEIRRIQISFRLQKDLRVNLPGCALALDLLDKLEELRRPSRLR